MVCTSLGKTKKNWNAVLGLTVGVWNYSKDVYCVIPFKDIYNLPQSDSSLGSVCLYLILNQYDNVPLVFNFGIYLMLTFYQVFEKFNFYKDFIKPPTHGKFCIRTKLVSILKIKDERDIVPLIQNQIKKNGSKARVRLVSKPSLFTKYWTWLLK